MSQILATRLFSDQGLVLLDIQTASAHPRVVDHYLLNVNDRDSGALFDGSENLRFVRRELLEYLDERWKHAADYPFVHRGCDQVGVHILQVRLAAGVPKRLQW